jgi:hypothetical protein
MKSSCAGVGQSEENGKGHLLIPIAMTTPLLRSHKNASASWRAWRWKIGGRGCGTAIQVPLEIPAGTGCDKDVRMIARLEEARLAGLTRCGRHLIVRPDLQYFDYAVLV